MSIFGKLDVANIPSNPFFIEKGEYLAEVHNAEYKTDRDGNRQLVIDFVITDDTSQYLDSRAQKYFDLVDENMTQEMMAMLPVEEQKTIRRNLSALKNMLCGNGRNKGLGVEVDDLNSGTWEPSSLKGTPVDLAITNYGTDGVNVRWANIREV